MFRFSNLYLILFNAVLSLSLEILLIFLENECFMVFWIKIDILSKENFSSILLNAFYRQFFRSNPISLLSNASINKSINVSYFNGNDSIPSKILITLIRFSISSLRLDLLHKIASVSF